MNQKSLLSRSLPFLLVLASWVIVGAPSEGQSCIDGNVASAAPAALWGSLQPGVAGAIPPARDSTDYTGQQLPNFRYPLFSALDVENGYVFVAYSFGIQLWDARGANAADPQAISSRDGFRCNEWLDWPSPCNSAGEARWVIWDIDAPAGSDTVVAASGDSPASLSIWDTSLKTSPTAKYQDTATNMKGVYTATINGRDYAFATGSGINGVSGVSVYDMTSALNLPVPCVDTNGAHTCGVWSNRFGSANAAFYVDGFRRSSDAKHFLAVSSGTALRGVELWNISTPASPVNLHSSGGRFLSTEFVYGVALWEQGANNYLGAWVFNSSNNQYEGRIYNVTACLAGNCSSFGAPVFTLQIVGPIATSAYYTTFSVGNGTPYLYFGHDGKCLAGLKKEWLYDLSPLASGNAPIEITPPQTITAQVGGEGPTQVDYWSYAYALNPGGFSQVMPRVGKFFGDIFYRAAWTLFDTHRRVDVAPQIQVTAASTGYNGAAVSFTGSGLNCTPATNGWSWSATGGGTGAGNTANPAITWSTPGNYTVSATNTACSGAMGTANIQILNAAPAVTSVTANPSTAPVCTPISFTAQNVTGRPPLTLAWRVLAASTPLPGVTGSGNPFVWNTAAATAGVYQGEVTVSNGFGSPAVALGTVTLTALSPLPGAGTFIPTHDPFTGATVQFHVNAAGATEWNWNFGDGVTTGWVADPNTGPNPTHTYTAVGPKSVTVSVRNCQAVNPVTSLPSVILITQTEPLLAAFAATGCSFGLCAFTTGQTVNFTDLSTGMTADTVYFYDWEHTGTNAGSCVFPSFGAATPTLTHVYTAPATVQPCLKLVRGGESSVTVHSPQIILSGATTKSIAISGPASAVQGQLHTFSATAANCTAAANGWTWNTAGSAVTGATSQSTVQITWSTIGNKTVTVANSGCTATSGTKSVNVVAAGAALVASFAYQVPDSAASTTLTFDAAGSAGSIALYSWTFPGGVVKIGPQVSHTFSSAGTFPVTLEVRACAAAGCPAASITKNVVVTPVPN